MSVGRFILRGWAFQSRVYAPWALGNSGAVVTVAEQTRRHRLIGTAATRATLTGTSAGEVQLIGTTGQRHSLTGATR